MVTDYIALNPAFVRKGTTVCVYNECVEELGIDCNLETSVSGEQKEDPTLFPSSSKE
ncbi:MAG TPA: hypothetical protein VHO70_22775 [Chitinispirillaceae bacterium]|nr:hypothetical protein [Chitinispirillaceae bacterium]